MHRVRYVHTRYQVDSSHYCLLHNSAALATGAALPALHGAVPQAAVCGRSDQMLYSYHIRVTYGARAGVSRVSLVTTPINCV